MAGRLYVPGSAAEEGATATSTTTDQNEELLKEHASQVEPEVQEVETAFIVFQDENGMWVGSSDLTIPISAKRVANLHDIYAGSVSIADDVSSAKTAQQVLGAMQAQANAMREQMQNQQVLSKLQQQSGVFKRG